MNYQEPISLLTENEVSRLEKLRDYQILDTHSEDTFDKIALMASQVFGAPTAFIVFVDEHRVFLKSNLSQLPYNEVDRGTSLSSLAILQDNVTVIEDTYAVPYLIENNFIAIKDSIRFFAGAPLKSPEGHNVGAICVGGDMPYTPTALQLDMLKTLSKIVIDKLENRLRYRKTVEAQVNLMNITLHELKNPLASIKLANEILAKDVTTKDRMSEMIKSSVARIQAKLAQLLKQSEMEENQMLLSIEEVDMNEMFERLINNFELLANRKSQKITLECEDNLPTIDADKAKISDILHNLLSNAIKYSYYGSTIQISAREIFGYFEFKIKDEGQGLNKDDVSRLFKKFAKLSSKPTGRETSNGLGLSITKSLVELHNGTIQAISAGKDKGTQFIVTLPVRYVAEAPQEISH